MADEIRPTNEQIAEGEAVFADKDGTRGVMDLNGWPVVDGKKAVRALVAAYVQRDESRAECKTLRCRIVELEEQAERARKLFVDYRGEEHEKTCASRERGSSGLTSDCDCRRA